MKKRITLSIDPNRIQSFRRTVWRNYHANGRTLPFRNTTNQYRIAVSEIMLQQTQVSRVVPKYLEWIRTWKSWRSLSRATNRELLAKWAGLGYNRRALNLGKLARIVVTDFDGKLPGDPRILITLPGVGPYTANAIAVFAFNVRTAAVDTNVRRAIRYWFDINGTTPNSAIDELAHRALPRSNLREWHYALMDYGAQVVPRNGIKRSSNGSSFNNTNRFVRGAIVRYVTRVGSSTMKAIAIEFEIELVRVRNASRSLAADGVVKVEKNRVSLVEWSCDS